MRKVLAFSLAFGAAASGLSAQEARLFDTSAGNVKVEKIAGGIAHPWGMEFLPGGDILATSREGAIFRLHNGALSAPAANLPQVWARGQGGLLDVALDHDFAANAIIYFSYSEPGEGGAGTAVARAKLAGSAAAPVLEDVKVIYRQAKKTSKGQHFGSRIVPAGDGTLFITNGDRGQQDRAQDPMDHAGSVLRITTDGGIPADNPFADGGQALPEIWSTGHRNPQGADLDPETGLIWIIEHGARGGDELNQPQAGRNYGWPVISYGRHYSGFKIGKGTGAEGYEQPVYYWDPSIAPSGLAFYDGALFPQWKGDALVGALSYELIARLDMKDGKVVEEERLFAGQFGRIRDVKVGPDGAIYFLTDESDGGVFRVSPAS